MAKRRSNEPGVREAWIQQRLGERKYRQLQMHLTGALRLLGELAAETDAAGARQSTTGNLKAETVTAMAALTERLRALPRNQRALPVRELPRAKRRKAINRR
jgi:hypothetical protein